MYPKLGFVVYILFIVFLLDFLLGVQVDLLGDEVDALLSLLEKIYIALDHYSPILQHYPGVRYSFLTLAMVHIFPQ